MHSEPAVETAVLRASRFKWFVTFVASGAFALGGVLVFFAAPGGRVGGIVVVAFFGFCTIVAGGMLIFRSRLVLAPDGFTVYSLGRRVTRRWADIESFVVIRPSAFTEMVGINFLSGYQWQGVRKTVRTITGYETALPDTFGMRAADLAALLNEWRARSTPAGPDLRSPLGAGESLRL